MQIIIIIIIIIIIKIYFSTSGIKNQKGMVDIIHLLSMQHVSAWLITIRGSQGLSWKLVASLWPLTMAIYATTCWTDSTYMGYSVACWSDVPGLQNTTVRTTDSVTNKKKTRTVTFQRRDILELQPYNSFL